MAALTVTHPFFAGTLAKASEVNQNFSDIVTWGNGGITDEHIGTLGGVLEWVISAGSKAISITNSSVDGSIDIVQADSLGSLNSVFSLVDSGVQTIGKASMYIHTSSLSSTIPALRVDYANSQVLAVNKNRVEITASASSTLPALKVTDLGTTGSAFSVISTTKASLPAPVMTTAQRNALSGVTEGMQLFNTTEGYPEFYDGGGWVPLKGDDTSIEATNSGFAIMTSGVTTAKIANSNVTAAKIENSVNLPGANVRANSRTVVVSGSSSASTNMQICVADITAGGGINYSEGISGVAVIGPAQYSIAFTNAFSVNPIVQVTPEYGGAGVVHGLISSKNGLGCVVRIVDSGGSPNPQQFSLLVIGTR